MSIEERLRRQLFLDREQAKARGEAALAILQAGGYRAPSGDWIDLRAAIARTQTIAYPPLAPLPPPPPCARAATACWVENATTLGVAQRLKGRVLALNLASPREPGGGFRHGARAQEEYLARSSTLYAGLVGQEMYAEFARNPDPFALDHVLFTKEVTVFCDDDGVLLQEPWSCGILSAAAVMAHRVPPSRQGEIGAVMARRARRVLGVARAAGGDALVLGAWGCGAFGNDPDRVAAIFASLLASEFAGAFAQVVFAIADWSEDARFIGPFQRALGTRRA